MEFTGERFVPELEGNIALEHLHRYAVARELARGMHVLDIACGEGYGSAMLAEVAGRVIGVDISKDVIDHAAIKYRKRNLEFKVGSCSSIPVENASVDLVVSFETLEHHDQHEAMMSEIRRVLRPEGVLIISSPEKHEYSVVPSYSNPFHIRELHRDEFEKLIGSYFKHAALFGQRIVYASGIAREKDTGDMVSFSQENGSIKVNEGIARPLYLIAVASDGTVPKIATGILEQRSRTDVLRDHDSQTAALAERDAQIAHLNQSVLDLTEKTLRLESELRESRSRLIAVLRSNSWRITLPLRETRRWFDAPGAQSKRYAKGALWQLKRACLALPLSVQIKALIRNSDGPPIGAEPAEKIVLPTSRSPFVSVIVPDDGKLEHTLRCLKSIERHLPRVPFEVIVVANGPPDNATGLPSRVSGLRFVTSSENSSFVHSCNAGAKQAAGEYLLFLHNDTEVTQDWMDKLLGTFDEIPGKVKIAAVTMVYNEALILPYFLRHYGYLDEIHVLYETDSTDDSLELLMQAPNVVIRKGHIEGGLDDIEKINLINKAVERINADWVYVVDPDEFIYPPDNESPHRFLIRQSCDVVRSGMYQVYRNRNDKDLDPSLPPIPQRVHGDPDLFSTDRRANRASNSVYVKPNIVRPSKRIRFLPGHHQIDGGPRTSAELYVGAHWQMADPSIAIARRMERKARISQRNRAHHMGWQHFNVSVDTIREECDRHLDDPIIDALRSFSEVSVQSPASGTRSDHLFRDSTESPNEQTAPASVTTGCVFADEGNMYKFDPTEHPICLSLPRRTVPFLSWRQHIPFGMLLVDLLKPKILVELGVHYGDSYCAFCQAVAELRLMTSCYGVDTWAGDPHASLYGPEVMADLTAHHDPLYGSFSHLIRCNFDEALQHFPDGAIDLLHIDGYHTYQAVKHDFETWLPKMSSRGVILLHDINEKQGDFGAWRVWDEVKPRFPHFEFLHCHGLGVVAAGERPPEQLGWLFEADDEKAAAIRGLFFCLGERLTDKLALSARQALAAAGQSELESLRAARTELEAVRSTATWRAAKRLRFLIDPVLPVNTRRRAYAQRLLSRMIRIGGG
jgi:SAM-dependent methyltransferase/glycosyltransferase involved in cell wall biosynthesis